MTGNAKTPAQRRSKVPSRKSIFGPAPILAGEDAAAYDDLLANVSGAVKPSDFIEEIWVRDVVDLTWEIFRWRRLRTSLLTSAMLTKLEGILAPLVCKRSATTEETESVLMQNFAPSPEHIRASELARKLVEKWAMRDPAAIIRVSKLISSANVTIDTVMAATFMDEFDHIERIDRSITIAEGRRNMILREVDRRRSAFAHPLRKTVQNVEEAEFKLVASNPPTSEGELNKTAA